MGFIDRYWMLIGAVALVVLIVGGGYYFAGAFSGT